LEKIKPLGQMEDKNKMRKFEKIGKMNWDKVNDEVENIHSFLSNSNSENFEISISIQELDENSKNTPEIEKRNKYIIDLMTLNKTEITGMEKLSVLNIQDELYKGGYITELQSSDNKDYLVLISLIV